MVASHTDAVPRARGWFFAGTAALMLLVVFLGFGRSFFLRPLYIEAPLPPHLIVHGVVMTTWFLLFLVQAVLVRAKRITLHRRLGLAGVVVALAAFVTGVLVNVRIASRAMAADSPERTQDMLAFAAASLVGLLPFVPLFVLALWYVRRPAVHKRMMYWAFAWMLGPAFTNTRPLGRVLDALVAPQLPFFPSDLLWLIALVVYDWRTMRRVHPATYLTFVLLAVYALVLTPRLAGHPAVRQLLLALAGA
jgi:hypothetical protein